MRDTDKPAGRASPAPDIDPGVEVCIALYGPEVLRRLATIRAESSAARARGGQALERKERENRRE